MEHTDNNGRKADFRNVIFVMTTNAGAEYFQALDRFRAGQQHGCDGGHQQALYTEFRNRLDAIVPFEPLDQEVILTVVDKFSLHCKRNSMKSAFNCRWTRVHENGL